VARSKCFSKFFWVETARLHPAPWLRACPSHCVSATNWELCPGHSVGKNPAKMQTFDFVHLSRPRKSNQVALMRGFMTAYMFKTALTVFLFETKRPIATCKVCKPTQNCFLSKASFHLRRHKTCYERIWKQNPCIFAKQKRFCIFSKSGQHSSCVINLKQNEENAHHPNQQRGTKTRINKKQYLEADLYLGSFESGFWLKVLCLYTIDGANSAPTTNVSPTVAYCSLPQTAMTLPRSWTKPHRWNQSESSITRIRLKWNWIYVK